MESSEMRVSKRTPPPPKNVIEVIEDGNIRAEITSRDHVDSSGKTKTYFDVLFLRTYMKDGDTIVTKNFQFKDLDRLMGVVGQAKSRVSDLIREVIAKDSDK